MLPGCRVRGSRDSGLTYSNDDVEFGNYQIPENWDQEAVVEALTKVLKFFAKKRKLV